MFLANHYIFRDLLDLIERRKMQRLNEICNTYIKRYMEDPEFQNVCSCINQYMDSDREHVRISEIEDRLKELVNLRRRGIL